MDYILQIPAEITAALEPIKDNEEAVRNYGIHLGTEMCRKILANGINTLHLYTLNMEKSALAILMVLLDTLSFCLIFPGSTLSHLGPLLTYTELSSESWLD